MRQYSDQLHTDSPLLPIPEKRYVRFLSVGKLQPSSAGKKLSSSKFENNIYGIWKVIRKYSKKNCIAGHFSFTKTLHGAWLFEGEEKVVLGLMKRIRRDPRVVIHKEFCKHILTMNQGWEMSKCCSFNITKKLLGLIENENVTLEQIFNRTLSTYVIKQSGLNLAKSYRDMTDVMLLKYITMNQKELDFKEV